MPETLPLHSQLIRFCDALWIATVGSKPCCGVTKALPDENALFIGYTDACTYLTDDVGLEKGGYESDSFAEYGLKGPPKTGVTALYTLGFAVARDTMLQLG